MAGGVLVTAAGWRSIFLVNVPICLVTIVLLRRYATESPRNQGRQLDVPGLLLGVTMLHAGVASGILNAARQSGGALGVAVLGSLLGHTPSLHVPLLVATAGYLGAIALAWTTHRER